MPDDDVGCEKRSEESDDGGSVVRRGIHLGKQRVNGDLARVGSGENRGGDINEKR